MKFYSKLLKISALAHIFANLGWATEYSYQGVNFGPCRHHSSCGWILAPQQDIQFLTNIFQAIALNDFSSVKSFLAKDAALVKTRDQDGDSPLAKACRGGQGRIVNLLLYNAADPTEALLAACEAENCRIVRLLIQHGADVRSPSNVCYAARGSPCILKILLTQGSSLDLGDPDGRTLLHEAARDARYESVDFLVSAGISPNVLARGEATPFHALASTVAAINSSDHRWQKRVEKTATHLLSAGANINAKTAVGDTALIIACESQTSDFARFLLQRGANPNATNHITAALHIAARNKQVDLVRDLLRHGADPNLLDLGGATPLHWTACSTYDDETAQTDRMSRPQLLIARMLLRRGAKADVADKLGKRPIDWAREHHAEELVKILSDSKSRRGQLLKLENNH
jgi:ankyrin repeat protein